MHNGCICVIIDTSLMLATAVNLINHTDLQGAYDSQYHAAWKGSGHMQLSDYFYTNKINNLWELMEVKQK